MTDYYSDPRLSNSKLTCLAQDPRKFKALYVDNPPTWKQPDNDAFVFGHAVHCLALEPDEFEKRFAVAPKVDRRTTAGKVAWAEHLAHSEGKQALDDQAYEDALACVQALNNHAEYAAIMAQPKRIEESMTVEVGSYQLKCKPDAIIDSERIIIDIKTTDKADPEKWKWSALDYGYDRQAAIYILALQQATGIRYRFKFAVIEKPTPSTRGLTPNVALIELEEESLDFGFDDACNLIDEYVYRIATNDWVTSYGKGTVPLLLPRRKEIRSYGQ